MSNQKKKNLGQGMKPRGNQPVLEVTENAVSADTGQEEAPADIIPRAPEGEQTPNNLEPEFKPIEWGQSVATPRSDSTDVLPVNLTAEDEESLTKILDESADLPAQMQREGDIDVYSSSPGGYTRLKGEAKDRVVEAFRELEARPGHPVPVVSTEVRNEFPTDEDIANHPLVWPLCTCGHDLGEHSDEDCRGCIGTPNFKHEFQRQEGGSPLPKITYDALGQQSDGTFKLVLSVDEGYIESIRQEAENGGITPEQWCSQQFNFFLESWWSKPKGR